MYYSLSEFIVSFSLSCPIRVAIPLHPRPEKRALFDGPTQFSERAQWGTAKADPYRRKIC